MLNKTKVYIRSLSVTLTSSGVFCLEGVVRGKIREGWTDGWRLLGELTPRAKPTEEIHKEYPNTIRGNEQRKQRTKKIRNTAKKITQAGRTKRHVAEVAKSISGFPCFAGFPGFLKPE